MTTEQPQSVQLLVNTDTDITQNGIANPTDYVPLPNDEEETPSDEAQSLITHTKYDTLALCLGFSSIVFLCSWICGIFVWIKFDGTTTAFCQTPYGSCDPARFNYTTIDCCVEGHYQDYEKRCYDEAQDECDAISITVAPFLAQIILIIFLLYCLYDLFFSLRKGIQIIEEKQTSMQAQHPLIQKIIQFQQRITVDFRKFIYKEQETPQKTSLDLIWKSLLFLSLSRLLVDVPIILFNLVSTDNALRVAGFAKLNADLMNVGMNLYAAISPCCNPWRGNCPCNACFDFVCCTCTCNHFPTHHEEYARAIGSIMRFTYLATYSGAIAQIAAVGFVDSTDQWNLILASANFVYGIYTVVTLMKAAWTYYYLLCFYWSRSAVSSDENRKIQNIFADWFAALVIFKVSIKKEDVFAVMNATERTASKVNITTDGWFFCWGFLLICILITGALGVFNCTRAFNQDFNSNYAYSRDNLCFSDW